MFNRFLLLLLLQCFISHSRTPTQSVTGQKGGNSILSCEFEARDIFEIKFYRLSKLICKKEECEHNNGTLFKKGSCDVIIKDLSFSDAGKYILRVYYTDDQTVLEPQTREYQLHIQAETSAQEGEQLKMDVLLINADKVEKNSSGEWTEVWTRGHGVSSDRLTDRDGNLTINKFTASDAGTYRVLDSEGEILITVTVTESGTQSKEKLDRDDDKTSDTEQPTVESWIIVLIGALLVLVISAVIWKYRRQHRNTEHEPVPMQDIVQ